MSLPCSVSIGSNKHVFGNGEHKTKVVKPEEAATPKPLLIFTPSEAGEFPVLVLLHGFFPLSNSDYSQLSHHIASHGFILVVPQLYIFITGPDATKDIECVAAISNWLSEGLQKFLPPQVNADLNKLVLAGHSRGGKVAFALALDKLHTEHLKFSALIGIDPVDGMDMYKQTLPKVLTYVPHSFNLEMPVMVIGSGFGEIKNFELPAIDLGFCEIKNVGLPAGAPKGVNHRDFYNECCKPACYFVAKDYGHFDMLDDDTGFIGWPTHWMLKRGESREPMRRFVGGAVVAFLKAYLEEDFGHLMAIKDEGIAPVALQKVDFLL